MFSSISRRSLYSLRFSSNSSGCLFRTTSTFFQPSSRRSFFTLKDETEAPEDDRAGMSGNPNKRHRIRVIESNRGTIYLAGVINSREPADMKEIQNLIRQTQPDHLLLMISMAENQLEELIQDNGSDPENRTKETLIDAIREGPEGEIATAMIEADRLNSQINISTIDLKEEQSLLEPYDLDFGKEILQMGVVACKIGFETSKAPFMSLDRNVVTKQVNMMTEACPRLMNAIVTFRSQKLFNLAKETLPVTGENAEGSDGETVVVLAHMPCMDTLEELMFKHYQIKPESSSSSTSSSSTTTDNDSGKDSI